VELRCKYEFALGRRHNRSTVFASSKQILAWFGGKGVNEIHPRVLAETLKQGRIVHEVELVPLHLRLLHTGLKAADRASEYTEPGDTRGLLGRVVQELHTNADAKKWPTRGDGIESRLVKASLS
jgi:hypothetical protein